MPRERSEGCTGGTGRVDIRPARTCPDLTRSHIPDSDTRRLAQFLRSPDLLKLAPRPLQDCTPDAAIYEDQQCQRTGNQGDWHGQEGPEASWQQHAARG